MEVPLVGRAGREIPAAGAADLAQLVPLVDACALRFATALLGLICIHCGDPSDPACTLGEERDCVGGDGCLGVQRCSNGSSGWSPCKCARREEEARASGDLEPNGSEEGVGTGGTGGAQEQRPVLGGECRSTGDCPRGAVCLREDDNAFLGGGPPKGMCVADCTEDPRVCESFSNAVCVDVDDSGESKAYCFSACDYGVAGIAKCGGRPDVAREQLNSDALGFCRPLCTKDEDCAALHCDRRNGVCSGQKTNDELGQPCSPDAGCAGICVRLNDSVGICSHRCVYGSATSCAGAGGSPGLCALMAPGGAFGDVGYCAELCDCNAECAHPDVHCDPFSTQTVRDLTGHAGVCAVTENSEREELRCTESD